jgi:hypothetical protein
MLPPTLDDAEGVFKERIGDGWITGKMGLGFWMEIEPEFP